MTEDRTGLPPKPGSPEAIAQGCTCAVIDNGHGRGYMGQSGIFVMSADCPLHGVSDAALAEATPGGQP